MSHREGWMTVIVSFLSPTDDLIISWFAGSHILYGSRMIEELVWLPFYYKTNWLQWSCDVEGVILGTVHFQQRLLSGWSLEYHQGLNGHDKNQSIHIKTHKERRTLWPPARNYATNCVKTMSAPGEDRVHICVYWLIAMRPGLTWLQFFWVPHPTQGIECSLFAMNTISAHFNSYDV